jgi:plasmid maintenance system antidote protein VapI
MNLTKLKNLMWDKHITQRDLSKLTGIDDATLSRILNGRRRCSPDRASKISKALKFSNKQSIEIFLKGE